MSRFITLASENFSGRTDWLRKSVGLPALPFQNSLKATILRNGAYVGETPSASLIGFAATTSLELNHQAASSRNDASSAARLIDYLRWRDLLSTSPYHLSGGEQAVLAIAGALLSTKGTIAVDTCTEQLAPELSEVVYAALRTHVASGAEVGICDNRRKSVFSSGSERVSILNASLERPRIQSNILDPSRIAVDHPVDVEISELHQAYGKRKILNGVSLRLKPSKVYRLLGSNGAGKSTLAKSISGVIRPDSMRASANGRAVEPWKAPGAVFGYHFQNPDHQILRPTVEAEIRASRRAVRATCEMMADIFGLRACLQRHPLDLPYVLRKRLALACIFSMPSPWYILDEPTLGQDTDAASEIAMLIRLYTSRGRSFIVITHNEDFAGQLDAEVLVLADGSIASGN